MANYGNDARNGGDGDNDSRADRYRDLCAFAQQLSGR
jgi:hypothetical protein